MLLGILICAICDFAITGTFTWSLITLTSIVFTWLVSFPIIAFGKKGILISMITLSVMQIPFMYILGMVINVSAIFQVGLPISILALLFIWGIFISYKRFKNRALFATGLVCIIAIPFTICINIILSLLIGEAIVDIWDIITILILLVIAFACFACDKPGLIKKQK